MLNCVSSFVDRFPGRGWKLASAHIDICCLYVCAIKYKPADLGILLKTIF